ncbi:pantoate--beta-alanine ligase [Pacificimonas flava]|uniref:Pantothenate synthetase n=1 Tax=Pacificimonas flava TaxID=1234595 RepID=M2U3D2_9SPHN|nr:pantoate--beta-alanine ligase [Pacificimonas flava]EMD82527.1 Pantoate--beta-alanine ligase [Pacificimonas flava]MBB5281357.1 pantoate--beta-alanine ligase [Pacificimonas flava]
MSSAPRIVRTVAALREVIGEWRQGGKTVGLVPTMGALHAGHLSLVAAARRHCDRAVVTIFVNPKQFAPGEDLDRYPRQEAQDAERLAEANCDLLFAPDPAEVYPPGFATTVSVAGLGEPLCGARRPGHFDGVATVVTKLLNQARADAAFFGEKDWQQLTIIRRLAADLDIGTRIEGVPTVREADGLALSSRNAYLSAEERRTAAELPRALSAAAKAIRAGTQTADALEEARTHLARAGFSPEYLEMRDERDLSELQAMTPHARLFVAARIGGTRLIDNLSVAGK